MAFFKYPYTNYEKINLDWILRKIKALEPAIPLVEQSAAIVEEVHTTAQEAAAAAASAQQAVATVTALAEQANETAEEAKEIATQSASATIADGSVVWVKLGTDVQRVITENTVRSTTSATNAALAQTAATTAQQTADTAQTTATAAQTTANSAQTVATAAQQTATAAQQTANTVINWTWIATLRTNNQSAQIPATAKEVLLEAFNFNLSPRLLCSMMFEVNILDVDSAINFNLVEQELYCVINSNKQVIFDPNETHTGDIRLRVCYR